MLEKKNRPGTGARNLEDIEDQVVLLTPSEMAPSDFDLISISQQFREIQKQMPKRRTL